MNTKFAFPGRGSGLARGLTLVLAGLMAVAGMLLLWATLFVGAVAFFGWWGWQKLRGRQPTIDLAAAFAQRRGAAFGRQLRQGEVVDVEVREVDRAGAARDTASLHTLDGGR
ncbi:MULTISPECIES: hypothetical protein [Aquincola]|uniref:hypothetical protein n=1 Tax=Aquincola TaxID=391952 RepID=UPI000614F413|nr:MULTISPECIES: hypothetical protein [Aquincola]MCR5864330.1 hypothetical protein [Aquincola sp. J276]